jgi:hypothetical protein
LIQVVSSAVMVAAMAGWFAFARGDGITPPSRVNVVVPDGVRIKVEVLNATSVRGLARRATFALRDAGFDVVSYGNDAELRDSTLVLVRSGKTDWAERLARVLGGARVESRPDSSRYLDITVLLGSDWRPPTKPFNP